MSRIVRFFCGRKGAAVGRMASTFAATMLLPAGAFVTWFALDLLQVFRDMSDEVQKIQVIIATSQERGNGLRVDLDRSTGLIIDHERRIIWLEAQRNRNPPVR